MTGRSNSLLGGEGHVERYVIRRDATRRVEVRASRPALDAGSLEGLGKRPCHDAKADFVNAPRLSPQTLFLPAPASPPVEWRVAPGFTDYAEAVAEMERRVEAIATGAARERVWLVEHSPLYTAGTSARDADLLDARFPVHRAGRGGQFTYHGPGQRVAYVMLDLKRRRPDVRAFVGALEGWLIDALAAFGVVGETRQDRVGVWVARPGEHGGVGGAPAEDKIAAIGVRVRRWVTFHGVALNVAPDLSHFSGIVPCGVANANFGVTSLRDLGLGATIAEADAALRAAFERRFGPTERRGTTIRRIWSPAPECGAHDPRSSPR